MTTSFETSWFENVSSWTRILGRRDPPRTFLFVEKKTQRGRKEKKERKMSAPYGELVVVLGDAHVGHRTSDLPEKFKKMLAPGKMQHLVSTGNLCSPDTYEFCKRVAPKMHGVKGDMDDLSSSNTSSEEIVFEVGEFRIGVCHGHQIVPWGDREALGLLSRRLNVDILVTGHTHVCEVFENEGCWFINPGSVTGAYTPLHDEVKPSFVLLSIQANAVKVYMYELNSVSGEVDIQRAKFSKPSKNPFQQSQPQLQLQSETHVADEQAQVVVPPPTGESLFDVPIPQNPPAKQVSVPPRPQVQDKLQAPALQKRMHEEAPSTTSPPAQKRAPPPRPPVEESISSENQADEESTSAKREVDSELGLANTPNQMLSTSSEQNDISDVNVPTLQAPHLIPDPGYDLVADDEQGTEDITRNESGFDALHDTSQAESPRTDAATGVFQEEDTSVSLPPPNLSHRLDDDEFDDV